MTERDPEAPKGSAAAKEGGEDSAQDGDSAQDYDAAAYALARARSAAKALGNTPTRRTYAPSRTGKGQKGRGKNHDGGEAFGSGRDPQGLDQVLNKLVRSRGWKDPIAVGSVLARWEELVGPEIAQHAKAENFDNTVVRVRTDSSAWARQLRFMIPKILAKIDQELGKGVVTEIYVVGPKAPSWRKGYLHVKGRGPRDTYG